MDSSAAGLLGFLMFMQLIFLLALLAGGLYALFALGRAASGLDRLASAVEEWVSRQDNSSVTNVPSTNALSTPTSPVPDISRIQSTQPSSAQRSIETNESVL
jgi:hypothetical protein